jgi:predicted MFS family arabinose efflux permease
MTDRMAAPRRAGSAQGIVLLMAAIMPIMAITSLVPVLPLLLREFADVQGSAALVSIALTVPALCVALFSPLAGWLSDKTGRKRLLVATLAAYAIAGIIPWFLTDLIAIIATRVVLGIMEATIMTVATAMIADYFEGEQRERWIAMQVGVGSMAAIVLVAIGGALGEIFGSRGPFLLYLLGFVVALLAALVLFEPERHAGQEPATQAARGVMREVWPLALITFGVGMLFYVLIVQIGPILEVSGEIGPSQVGLAAAAVNAGVMAGSILFKLSKRRAGPGVLSAGLAVAALGYAGAGLSEGFFAVTAFGTIGTMGAGILLPNMMAWTLAKLAPEVRGRGTGLWTGSFFLAQFVSPLAFGVVAEQVGGVGNALLAIAAFSGAAGLLTFVLHSGESRRRQAPL